MTLLQKIQAKFSPVNSVEDYDHLLEISKATEELRECNRHQLLAMTNIIEQTQQNKLSGDIIINDYTLTFNNGILIRVHDLVETKH